MAWWLFMPACVLIQWPGRTVLFGTSVNWAVWAALGGFLSFMDTSVPRGIKSAVPLGLFLAAVLIYIVRVLPPLSALGWMEASGPIFAFGSVAVWITFVVFGTMAALRYCPNFSKRLAPALFYLHLLNAAVFFAHILDLYHFWKYSENPGGFLPRVGIWAAWGALSLPILWAWSPWKVTAWGRTFNPRFAAWPAILPILWANSATACASLFCAGLWIVVFRRESRRGALLFLLAATALFGLALCRVPAYMIFAMIELRLATWLAALSAIASHPFGMGWSPITYDTWMKANWGRVVLPSCASDVLNVVLQNGWVAIPFLAWGVVMAKRTLTAKPLDLALLIAMFYACFQRSLSIAHIGILAWAIWLFWRIDRHEEEHA